MTNPDPNLIFYACIAKGTTILAEFNSKDADLGALALKCLEKIPQFHSIFSHTIRNKIYMFLIDSPFVYFGIFDANLEKSSCVSFLKSVTGSFNLILDQNPLKRLTTLNPHCFQGEFNPVFRQLLASPLDLEGPDAARMVLNNEGENLASVSEKRIGSMPLLSGKNLTKKKKRLFGEINGGKKHLPKENKVDVSSDNGITLSREFSLVNSHNKNGLFAVDKAKRVWRKQLWIVLSLDLIVCCILFGIWLWICRGFKCIAG